jgi:hypothetical protein
VDAASRTSSPAHPCDKASSPIRTLTQLPGGGILKDMTAIAEELDRKLRSLDAARAAQAEQLVRDLLALLDETSTLPNAERKAYATQTHDSGLMPGIDPTKLGQLAEEL